MSVAGVESHSDPSGVPRNLKKKVFSRLKVYTPFHKCVVPKYVSAYYSVYANEIVFAKERDFPHQGPILEHCITNERGSLCSLKHVIFFFFKKIYMCSYRRQNTRSLGVISVLKATS